MTNLSYRAIPRSTIELRQLLHALPKVDLHRHLEGSLRLETLAEIAQEHGIDLPGYNLDELRPYVQFTNEEPDFHRFLEKFKLLRRFYTTREAVKRVAYEAVIDAAADNVKYLELRFNPASLAHTQSFHLPEVAEWVIEAVNQAKADTGIEVRLLCTAVRHDSYDLARQVIEVAIQYRDHGIVGVDLAGDEVHFPAAPFAPLFRRAADHGLGITIHAGEAAGANNVREAIEVLRAQRIGHGIRTIEDSNVVQLVRQRNVALEVCPTSNLQTGAVDNFGLHPLRDLYVLGVNVTLNTDDPSVSDITLTDEYMVAIMGLGVQLRDLRQYLRNAIEAAFLPVHEKQELATRLLADLDQLLAQPSGPAKS
jgi:adenosine deaminase